MSDEQQNPLPERPPLRLVDEHDQTVEINLRSEGFVDEVIGHCDDHVVLDTPLSIDGKPAGTVQTWISVQGADLSLRVEYRPDPERHPEAEAEGDPQ